MKAKTETTTASLAVVGVDIGKEVFHLVGLNTDGTIAFAVRSGGRASKMCSSSCHRALWAWRPA